jgi:hypothetical protein
MHDVSEALGAWNSFYVLIGSSAGALTGLMFVVITLITDGTRTPSEEGIKTFSSPTVFHFCCVLFVAALMSAPFRFILPVAIMLALGGIAGLVYSIRVALHTSNLPSYEPDAEDWTWNVLLPFLAYSALIGGAIGMHWSLSRALFAPAAGATLLIFIGIHNAWDVVTFLAMGKNEEFPEKDTT